MDTLTRMMTIGENCFQDDKIIGRICSADGRLELSIISQPNLFYGIKTYSVMVKRLEDDCIVAMTDGEHLTPSKALGNLIEVVASVVDMFESNLGLYHVKDHSWDACSAIVNIKSPIVAN